MSRAELLLEEIGELATVTGPPGPLAGDRSGRLDRLSDATIAVDRGRIVFVGRARAARREVQRASGGRTIDLGGATVVPGFVDAHTHLLFGGDRARELEAKVRGASYADLARAGGGIVSTVRATRRASTAELLRSAGERLLRMVEGGTTTAEVKSGYALTHAGELRLLELVPALARRSGLRLVPTYLGAHAVPDPGPGGRARYVREIVERTLPAVADRRLARFCDAFVEPGFFTVHDGRRILSAARTLGLGRKIHADEFVDSGGAALAAEVGATSADHLLRTGASGRRELARAGVIGVLLPVSPFASMSGHPSPGRELVDAGVPVALGTDLSPNSWVAAMPLVVSHAVFSGRLTPSEALVASTENAAHAIGLGGIAGRIAVGRDADLAAFDLPSADHIAYRIGARPTLVLRRGRTVFPR